MGHRRLLFQRGFTLIELLIVVAVIGIIAAMLIPNFLDAMQKTKQKRTMGEIHIVGTALMSWLTDQSGAAAAGATNVVSISNYSAVSITQMENVLKPKYIQDVPRLDGWKNTFDYRVNIVDAVSATHVMAVRSGGRDGQYAGNDYTPGSFDPTDYDQDIVWTDGFFIRWPQKASTD
jgi:type II secretion system protein G